ncbi:MFS transporter [Halobaculum magnesiiphilum]|uniref:MFS transporter n=1 Tax=Halobaculum magnesiiphilum TaxID=1017351 RepID=A0A8T8WE43_9EURY|nr:MFS transporter [Halobaculum magnesiiphilum]QZP37994.1 MFS transporter [Halobaculum magnesiiphilum]
MPPEWPRSRVNRNDRSIVGLTMLAHGMVHTYELSIPIFIPIWLAEFDVVALGPVEVAVTSATLGLLVTVGYGLFGLGALPGGVLVDRVGSRRLITACLVGMAASFVLLGVAPGLVSITLAMVVWGVSASVYHPAGLALLSKGVEERGTGFAYHGMAGNLGIGLGPLLTTLMLLALDWRTAAAILAAPALLAALYAVRASFDETAAVETAADGGTDAGDSKADAGVDSFSEFVAESRVLFTGSFALVFLVVMLSGLYYRGVLTFMPELLDDLPGFAPVVVGSLLPGGVADLLGGLGGREVSPANYVYSGLLMVGVVGQYVGGKLTDRIPVERGIALSFGVLGVLALLFLPVANLGFGPFLVFGAVLGAALFVVQPFYQATVAEYTPAGTRGLSYGYTYLGVFGVGALGGAVAGTVLTYANPPTLFGVLAAIGFVASATGVVLARR